MYELDYPMTDLKSCGTHYNSDLHRNVTTEEEQEYYNNKGDDDKDGED